MTEGVISLRSAFEGELSIARRRLKFFESVTAYKSEAKAEQAHIQHLEKLLEEIDP